MKIEELTQKIYEEGVEKAKQQETELLDQARKEAERIVADARREAEQVKEAARKEAEQAKARLAAELKLTGDQAVAQLRSRIIDSLVDTTLPDNVEAALADTEFMQKLILELVERWDTGRTNLDITVVLSPESQKALGDFFAKKTKQLLDRGLAVSFSDEVSSGFQIRSRDGGYRISFEEEDFVSFFRGFLRERTREVLFPSGETGSRSERAGQNR